jgi:hypothetical protein
MSLDLLEPPELELLEPLDIGDVDLYAEKFNPIAIEGMSIPEIICCVEALFSRALHNPLSPAGLSVVRTLGAAYVYNQHEDAVTVYTAKEGKTPKSLEVAIDEGLKEVYAKLSMVRVRKILVALAATCGVVKEVTQDNGTYLLKRVKAHIAATSGSKAAKTISIPENSQNPFSFLRGEYEKLLPVDPGVYLLESATSESIEQTLNSFSYHVEPLPWAKYLFASEIVDKDIRCQAKIVMTGYGVTGFKNIQDVRTSSCSAHA